MPRPTMPSDFAPLSRKPLTITVAGTDVLIPYRAAALWVEAQSEMHRLPLAASLADEEGREVITDLLITHPRAEGDLKRESLRILGDAAGRKWWEAGRLLSTSVSAEVLGRLVLSGVDPWTRSLGEWCAATYALCVKGQDEKGRLRFDFSLSVPPPGHEEEWDDDGDDPAAIAAAVAKLKR